MILHEWNKAHEKWVVNDRDGFGCVRFKGYDILTLKDRKYVGNIMFEEDAEYIVEIHNKRIDELSENKI